LSPALQPFGLAGGRLRLDGVDLAEIAEGLDGRPAWVISASAVSSALVRAAKGAAGRRRAVTVGVGSIGPPAVLALAAQAGAWASVASGHELSLARQAGFPPRRLVVQAPALDDGFILEALSARVAVLVRRGRKQAEEVRRIAIRLGLPQPRPDGAPPRVGARAFARCGGLLARLLDGPPRLVLDALWEPTSGPSLVVPLPAPLAPADATPSAAARPAPSRRRVTLAGLAAARGGPAWLLGAAARGDWVAIPAASALAVRPPHPAWTLPGEVLVTEGRWRLLESRPMPPAP